MVSPGGIIRLIYAETFVLFIIIISYNGACPAVFAFDTEMVVRMQNQPPPARLGFKNALGQGNGGGYARSFHFFLGNIPVLQNIGMGSIRLGACPRVGQTEKDAPQTTGP